MKVKVNIIDFCNYDGMCQLSNKNAQKYGYSFCDYGDKFGTPACPLLSPVATIEVVDKDDVPIVDNPK